MKQTAAPTRNAPAVTPAIVHQVLRSPGRPLEPGTRTFMENRLGYDFGRVRVHTDAQAAESARAVNALAYTVGPDVVFSHGALRPELAAGRHLLAHELAHTVQQGTVKKETSATDTAIPLSPAAAPAEREADHAAADALAGRPATITSNVRSVPVLQRQGFHTPPVSVRSPVFEETATQLTELEAGRPLTRRERALVRGIFGESVDYSRVRLIRTSFLEYRTVANSIRVPTSFTIDDEAMAQTLIHEMTHVWQYQHGGTSYISISLGSQIAAYIATGDRDAAYDYQIDDGQSFFDFMPEQQASLVESYFAMLRDQAAIPRDQAAGQTRTYQSNHRRILSAADRLAEISRELPQHEPLIRQMSSALPRSETEILMLRATDVMQTPGPDLAPVSPDQQILPIRPLFEFRFPGL